VSTSDENLFVRILYYLGLIVFIKQLCMYHLLYKIFVYTLSLQYKNANTYILIKYYFKEIFQRA